MQNQYTESEDWDQRAQSLRTAEWKTITDLFVTCRKLLTAHALRQRGRASLYEISRMLALASKLGRLATELDKDDGMEGQNGYPIPLSIKEAVERIYGKMSTSPREPGKDSSPNPPSAAQHRDASQPSTLNSQPLTPNEL